MLFCWSVRACVHVILSLWCLCEWVRAHAHALLLHSHHHLYPILPDLPHPLSSARWFVNPQDGRFVTVIIVINGTFGSFRSPRQFSAACSQDSLVLDLFEGPRSDLPCAQLFTKRRKRELQALFSSGVHVARANAATPRHRPGTWEVDHREGRGEEETWRGRWRGRHRGEMGGHGAGGGIEQWWMQVLV